MTSTAGSFVDRVRATISTRGLFAGGETVVVAVSGGPDSLAMLTVLHELAPILDLHLHVAHFDHRLRAGSADDARFVRETARSLGLPCTVGHWHRARPPRSSPEDAARTARARFLDGVARSIGAARIATGHTRDDQAETVLMRLLQGTGRRGLGGIDPRRWWRVRPLIDVRRAEVEAFCDARGLTPVRDPMNLDRSLLRNEIRLGVLPVLRERLNAGVDDALARLADIARAEDAVLDDLAAHGAPAVTGDDGETRVSIEALGGLPLALQRRALRLATWTHNNATFSAEHTERLRLLALEAETGDGLDLPAGIRARVEYGVLVLGSQQPGALPPAAVMLALPGEHDLVGWNLRLRSWVTTEPPGSWPDGRRVCVLDADAVAFPASVRAPVAGDRFRPLGMDGEKKVGDFFTDERVPQGRRDTVPLLVDATGRVAWVIGYRIDDRARVRPETTRYLWVQAEGGHRG